jgi:hypothetical protein
MKTNHIPTEVNGRLAAARKRAVRTLFWGDFTHALDIAKTWLGASQYRAFRTELLAELNRKAAA